MACPSIARPISRAWRTIRRQLILAALQQREQLIDAGVESLARLRLHEPARALNSAAPTRRAAAGDAASDLFSGRLGWKAWGQQVVVRWLLWPSLPTRITC
jgi:hypothetical protein